MATTYIKALRTFGVQTRGNQDGNISDTLTSQNASNALMQFEAHKTIALVPPEEGSDYMLVPFHATETATLGIQTEEVEKVDPYCDEGGDEQECTWETAATDISMRYMEQQNMSGGNKHSDYNPQIGDVARVTYLGEVKEFPLMYSQESVPGSGRDGVTYSNVDMENWSPSDPTEYAIFIFSGYVGSVTRELSVTYMHDFDIDDGSTNPMTIEYCRK